MRKSKRIPYDRTGGVDEAMPAGGGDLASMMPQAPDVPPGGLPGPEAGGGMDPMAMGGGMDPSAMVGPQEQGGGLDLASILGGAGGDQMGMDPMMAGGDATMDPGAIDDQALQDMLDAVENPDTPPEIRDAINAQIALAARRRLAGVGGVQ